MNRSDDIRTRDMKRITNQALTIMLKDILIPKTDTRAMAEARLRETILAPENALVPEVTQGSEGELVSEGVPALGTKLEPEVQVVAEVKVVVVEGKEVAEGKVVSEGKVVAEVALVADSVLEPLTALALEVKAVPEVKEVKAVAEAALVADSALEEEVVLAVSTEQLSQIAQVADVVLVAEVVADLGIILMTLP